MFPSVKNGSPLLRNGCSCYGSLLKADIHGNKLLKAQQRRDVIRLTVGSSVV
jgi:hypothetical protein